MAQNPQVWNDPPGHAYIAALITGPFLLGHGDMISNRHGLTFSTKTPVARTLAGVAKAPTKRVREQADPQRTRPESESHPSPDRKPAEVRTSSQE